MEIPPDPGPGHNANGKSSSKAKQGSRSVLNLSKEQLETKRTQDRESQRQSRLRTKLNTERLESRVAELIQQLTKNNSRVYDLTQQLTAVKAENDLLKAQIQWDLPGCIPQTTALESMPVTDWNIIYSGMEVVSQRKMAQSNPGPMTTEIHDILDPGLFIQCGNNELVQQQPIPTGVWTVLPCHYPPTCRLDQIFSDLRNDLKSFDLIREFRDPKFPSVAHLLNPHHATIYPLATTITSHPLLPKFPENSSVSVNSKNMAFI